MASAVQPLTHKVGSIPVQNLWLMMLYASQLTRYPNTARILLEDDSADIPDLVCELLAQEVQRRLRRNLTAGYVNRSCELSRVRGRIDWLKTETGMLLPKGRIFCRFQELSTNTPRNRLIRAALERASHIVSRPELGRRCDALALSMARMGVQTSHAGLRDAHLEQLGRNDQEDRVVLALATLVFDLSLLTEQEGDKPLFSPSRDEVLVRRLFEKAVLGFARIELGSGGWGVSGGAQFIWPIESPSSSLKTYLPQMKTDIILDPPNGGRRLVIDTKFASIFTLHLGHERFKSGYLYQIYAYLRSQENTHPDTDGMLLHPSIGESVCEHAIIQGHKITFTTVNLAGTTASIRQELRNILTQNESHK